MQKTQLEHWLHSEHTRARHPPKLYIIGCDDISDYLLAVECKHKLVPIHDKKGEVMHYNSIELVKEDLIRLGAESVYLRLHSMDDECGSPEGYVPYHDIKLALHDH